MAERFPQAPPDSLGNLAPGPHLAALHAYYLARTLAAGRDVLDLSRLPPGFSRLLEGSARSVRRLAFTNLPDPPPDPADLVLGLGLLETAPDAATLLAQLRALTRQGGLVLLDAATRDPAARRQLDQAEAAALLAPHFADHRIFAQLGLVGSALLGPGGPPLLFRHLDLTAVQVSRSVPEPDRLLLLAATAPLHDLTDSLLAADGLDRLAAAEEAAATLAHQHALLAEDHAALTRAADSWGQEQARLRQQAARLEVASRTAASEIAATAAARDAALAALARLAAPVPAAPTPPTATPPTATPPPPTAPRRPWWPRGLALPGRQRRRRAALLASGSFDPAWYRATYPDIAASGIDPARHYLRFGAAEGRNPAPGFDAAFYQAAHPDSRATSPAEHYAAIGRAQGLPTEPEPEPPALPAPARNPQILYVEGEPETPGALYRCRRYAASARDAGFDAASIALADVTAEGLVGVRVCILWRVRACDHVRNILDEVRRNGGVSVFDLDDLMLRPEYATLALIDGIRTTGAGLASTRQTFAATRQAMQAADLCTATTEELAAEMRAFQKAALVLPNGFDTPWLDRAHRALRTRPPQDGLVRVGYAGGTLTHQRDFAVALPGLVAVLAARPQTRLVLFRTPDGLCLVDPAEFESLAPFADRIEWRQTVPLASLPDEIARFAINLAPLEAGNPFCEAKSELKYFEAALLEIPTIASPTGPYARAIDHGRTGLLAADRDGWHDGLLRLVDDPALRLRLGRAARAECLWRFGPERRARLTASFLRQAQGGADGARAFSETRALLAAETPLRADPAEIECLFAHDSLAHDRFADDSLDPAEITVIVPCYQYAEYLPEALESVRTQTLGPLHLIIIDDASPDPMPAILAREFLAAHARRFSRALLLRHPQNQGLAQARNSGFAAARTRYVLPLDADNRLLPDAAERLLASIKGPDRPAFAYGSLRMFDTADAVFSNEPYRPARILGGNYIDAQALIALSAWSAAGGYAMPRAMGWEDFDFWCRLIELGLHGVHVPEILGEYRVHGASMLDRAVERDQAKQDLVTLIERRHPWLRLTARAPRPRLL